MSTPSTLLELSGAEFPTLEWSNCALVFIDYQNEYVDGAMPLDHLGEAASTKARLLLNKARQEGAPVFHVMHHGQENGSIFDPLTENVTIIKGLEPTDDEQTIIKTHPNAFYDTQLNELLLATKKPQVLFAGFMSHMCVSASVRAAFDLGFQNFVCHDACATRDLPNYDGGVMSAEVVHSAAMNALQDNFAAVVSTDKLLNLG